MRLTIAGLIILLGIVHICYVFPVSEFDSFHLWSLGSGIALILSGLINIIGIIYRRSRFIIYVVISSNSLILVLSLVSLLVLCGPQVYVGITLYFLATLLPLIQCMKNKGDSREYTHFTSTPNADSVEYLHETSVTPMLRIFDKKKAEEFYIGWLGFKIEWEHRFHDTAPFIWKYQSPE